MKIAVIGIGATGSYYAAKLSKDNDVIAFEHYENKIRAVNTNGINLIENDVTTNYKVHVYDDGTYKKVQDLVIVCVKATQTVEALKANLDLIDDHTIILTLQNGLGNIKDIARFVDVANIVVGSSRVNLVNEDINSVRVTGQGTTYIGSAGNDLKDVQIIKVLFGKAGFEVEKSDDINTLIWNRAIIHAVIYPLCSIFKCKIKVVYENNYIYELAKGIAEEACNVANADGAHIKFDELLNELRYTAYNVGNSYPSMYFDVQNSRITEIERLNGVIVNLGYKHKVDTSYNSFALNAIKGIEKLY